MIWKINPIPIYGICYYVHEDKLVYIKATLLN